MILCDTNVMVELWKNNPQIAAELRQIGYAEIAISVVTQAELYFGALNKKELDEIRRHLSLISQLPFSEQISRQFILLMETYSLSHKLSIPDALIAATAIEYGLPLYTLNVRDFRFIQNLQLYED